MGINNSVRFTRAFVAILLTSITFVNVSTLGAQATEVSAVTIVESGGDVKGTTWNVESGVLTATGTVSIDAEDIIAEIATSDLEISVGSLAVDSPINWSASTVLSLTSAGDLAINETIKATGDDNGNSSGGSNLVDPASPTVEPTDEQPAAPTAEPVDSPSALEDSSTGNNSLKWMWIPIAVLMLSGAFFAIARTRSRKN